MLLYLKIIIYYIPEIIVFKYFAFLDPVYLNISTKTIFYQVYAPFSKIVMNFQVYFITIIKLCQYYAIIES